MSYVVLLSVRTALFVVFTSAVAEKIRKPVAFRAFVDSLTTLSLFRGSASLARVLGYILVLCEGAAVVALIVSPVSVIGLGMATVLLASYAVVIGNEVRRGSLIECNCFGAGGQPLGAPHVWRNIALASLALLGLAVNLLGVGNASLFSIESLDALTAGVVVALLAVHTDDITFLLRQKMGTEGAVARGF